MTKRKDFERSPLSPTDSNSQADGKKLKLEQDDAAQSQPQSILAQNQTIPMESDSTSPLASVINENKKEVDLSLREDQKIIPYQQYVSALWYLKEQKILKKKYKEIAAGLKQKLGGSLEEVYYLKGEGLSEEKIPVRSHIIAALIPDEAFQHNPKSIEFLLEIGADPNGRYCAFGASPLEYLVGKIQYSHKQTKIKAMTKGATLLIEHPKTIIENDKTFATWRMAETILALNVKSRKVLVEALLKKKPDIFLEQDEKGNTVIHSFLSNLKEPIIEAFEPEYRHIYYLEPYLPQIINLPNNLGETPLHIIASKSQSLWIKMCRIVMEKGVLPEFTKANERGNTVLKIFFSRSFSGNTEILGGLLKEYFKDEKRKSELQSFIASLIETDLSTYYKYRLLNEIGMMLLFNNGKAQETHIQTLLWKSVQAAPATPEMDKEILEALRDNKKASDFPYALNTFQGKTLSQHLMPNLKLDCDVKEGTLLLMNHKYNHFDSAARLRAHRNLECEQLNMVVERDDDLRKKLVFPFSEAIGNNSPETIGKLAKDVVYHLFSFLDAKALKNIALTVKECGHQMRYFMANINGKKLYALSEKEGEVSRVLCLNDAERESMPEKSSLQLLQNPFAEKSGEKRWQEIVSKQKQKSQDYDKLK